MGMQAEEHGRFFYGRIPDLLTFFGFSVVLGRALPLGAPPPILPQRGDEPIRFSQRARRFTKEMGFL